MADRESTQSYRRFRYRLYPTAAQIVTLDAALLLCCEIYNAAVKERRDAWKIQRKSIHYNDQQAQLRDLKTARPDVKALLFSQVVQDVLWRVDFAYRAYFERRRRGYKSGFPRFRQPRRYHSLTYPQRGFAIGTRDVRLSKIGTIKIKVHRPVPGTIKTFTIKCEAGKWYAIVACLIDPEPLAVSTEEIGVDVGLTTFATLSDERRIENPRFARVAEQKIRRAERKMWRRRKGSNRWHKAVCLLQRAHHHVRQQRANFLHEESRKLVNRYGLIGLEALYLKPILAGHMRKSAYDAGWATFMADITYKAITAGRDIVKVSPRGTSQTCTCGAHVPKTMRDRWHLCPECGLSKPRDVVSAQLILQLARRARIAPSSVNVEDESSCVA